jgi:hypothetical protein
MKFIPASVVDDFFENPDEVREYGLSLEYSKISGNYPGVRTDYLRNINPSFYDQFVRKILGLFFGENCYVECEMALHFQKIYPYEGPPEINTGWVHQDLKVPLAGLVYLNKNSNPDAGTSIYRQVKERTIRDLSDTRDLLYANEPVDVDYYLDVKEKFHEQFEKTIDVKNVYNRLICYSGMEFHKESNFIVGEEPRLTLVFFIYKLRSSCKPPLPRSKVQQVNSF